MDEMVGPLRHALPLLQPPKRIRKKPAVNEDAQNESKRRRVSKASPE